MNYEKLQEAAAAVRAPAAGSEVATFLSATGLDAPTRASSASVLLWMTM